jgi:hypothetical protein
MADNVFFSMAILAWWQNSDTRFLVHSSVLMTIFPRNFQGAVFSTKLHYLKINLCLVKVFLSKTITDAGYVKGRFRPSLIISDLVFSRNYSDKDSLSQNQGLSRDSFSKKNDHRLRVCEGMFLAELNFVKIRMCQGWVLPSLTMSESGFVKGLFWPSLILSD